MPEGIRYPFSEERVRALRVGDLVAVSGRVFTGRDRVHRWLYDGGVCPVNLRDGALYHCGPVVVQSDGRWVVRAAGPTTSYRAEPYMARIIERHGIRLVIGKGGMGEGTLAACRRFGCAYLQAVGGAACLLAGSVRRVAGVHLLAELGSAEALWEFDVADMVCTVTMDARGLSLHRRVATASRRRLDALLKAS